MQGLHDCTNLIDLRSHLFNNIEYNQVWIWDSLNFKLKRLKNLYELFTHPISSQKPWHFASIHQTTPVPWKTITKATMLIETIERLIACVEFSFPFFPLFLLAILAVAAISAVLPLQWQNDCNFCSFLPFVQFMQLFCCSVVVGGTSCCNCCWWYLIY